MVLGHGQEFLNNYHHDFWTSCFVDKFPRGDCQECPRKGRVVGLRGHKWAQCLLHRTDTISWRMDAEFIATLFGILLRRDQIRAVELTVTKSPLSALDADKLNAEQLMQQAMSSGECNSVSQALRQKNIKETSLKKSIEAMQMVQRRVRGSEAERESLRYKFMAMRVWGGCSSLFLTLNPHDIRSPLTIEFTSKEHFHIERFSLDWNDSTTDAYFSELLGANPRKLHQIAAQDPVATTRCFYTTVDLVLECLLGCAPRGKCPADGIPAGEKPGIFGYVNGYMGAIEPQMRKALHVHMLIQLVGFPNPEDFFHQTDIVQMFRRVWSFVASIMFRSEEGFAFRRFLCFSGFCVSVGSAFRRFLRFSGFCVSVVSPWGHRMTVVKGTNSCKLWTRAGVVGQKCLGTS